MSSSMELRPRKKAKLDEPEASASTQTIENGPPSQHEDSIVNDTKVAQGKSSKAAARKTGKKARGRSKNKLEVLGFPVDVMIEICKLLHPRELCALVRTCTAMRNFLLKRNIEKTIWEAAFKNATDLPPRPENMSMPAFTHLLYAPFCHFCGAIARKVHHPAWLVRCCSECLYEVTYDHKEAVSLIQRASDIWAYAPKVCTMYTIPNAKGRCHCSSYVQDKYSHLYRFMKTEVDTVVRNFRRIRRKKLSKKAKAEALHEELNRAGEDRKMREHRGQRLAVWFNEQENQRAAQLDAKRAERFDAIIEKLRESGWDREMDFIDDAGLDRMADLPVVRRSTKLTPGEWLQVSHLPELTELLEETRAARLYAEYVQLVAGRLRVLEQAIALHYGVQVPRNAAMERHPGFSPFAWGCTLLTDAPKSRVLTPEDFLEVLPKIAADWQAAMTQEAIDRLRRYTKFIPEETENPLDLAVAIFKCRDCPEGSACMRFEDILFHDCCVGADTYELVAKRIIDRPDTVEDRAKAAMQRLLRGYYDTWALEPMQSIITALGLDPTRATAAELAACEGRLRCKSCAERGEPDMIYTWEAAMDHSYSASNGYGDRRPKHWGNSTWEAISEDDLVRVRELEAKAHVQSLDSIGAVWACSRCINWDGPGAKMKEHLIEEHGITDANQCVQDGTVYLHPTKSAPVVRPAVELPAKEEGSSETDAAA